MSIIEFLKTISYNVIFPPYERIMKTLVKTIEKGRLYVIIREFNVKRGCDL